MLSILSKIDNLSKVDNLDIKQDKKIIKTKSTKITEETIELTDPKAVAEALGLNEKKKKEYGLKFGRPSLSIVLTKAIGRGPTELSKYPCKSFVLKSLGFISSMSFNDQNKCRNLHWCVI